MLAATLFSGIGSPEQAMPHWDWRWCAEIDKFACAVLKARHPASVSLGDVTAHDFAERAAAIARPDVLVFGSPCQSFSVAGQRLGLDDPRGNLALVALGIVDRLKPRWFVFENVPGLLSSDQGRDFGIFLRTVDELRYRCAWSVLDAQYFGVAQRRERVFVVGHLGDWRRAAAVLLEPEGVRGHHPPRRKAGERTSPTIAPSLTNSGRGVERAGDTRGQDPIVVTHSLTAEGFDASEDGTGRGPPLVPVVPILEADRWCRARTGISTDDIRAGMGGGRAGRPDVHAAGWQAGSPPLRSEGIGGVGGVAIASEPTNGNQGEDFVAGSAVRRLTPVECERLQGFPDDYTLVPYRGKPAMDGPRYRALGNAMAVPVVRWILQRIEKLEKEHER